jgi:hypothetical protein
VNRRKDGGGGETWSDERITKVGKKTTRQKEAMDKNLQELSIAIGKQNPFHVDPTYYFFSFLSSSSLAPISSFGYFIHFAFFVDEEFER